MGLHSVVTCHSTQVNARRFNASQTSWYSIYLPRRDKKLSLLHIEMVYMSSDKQSLIRVVTI